MKPASSTAPVVSIRIAKAADAPAIIAVVNAAFSVEDFIDGTRTDDERLGEAMRKGTFLVAEDSSGRIVASVYTEMRGNGAYFGMLAVDPSQQGSGLGRKLIEAAEDHGRRQGARYMDIAVVSLRPELPPLYRRFGYSDIRTEEFKPSRPLKPGVECHAIIMSKEL